MTAPPFSLHLEGVTDHSPRSHASCAPWENAPNRQRNPNGVTQSDAAPGEGNPVGVQRARRFMTQGALAKPRDPGLDSATPLGFSEFRGLTPTATRCRRCAAQEESR